MKRIPALLLTLLISLTAVPALAMYTELGLSYGSKRTTFDANNYLETESLTGSLSFYFLERLALEMSYTDAKATRQEKASTTDPKRITYQTSQVLGADLVLTFADRKALFQPYIKGGMARLKRKQETSIEGYQTYTLPVDEATVPSYGVGLKIALTDSFNIKVSYDVWKTPIGDGNVSDDASLRAGVTWAL